MSCKAYKAMKVIKRFLVCSRTYCSNIINLIKENTKLKIHHECYWPWELERLSFCRGGNYGVGLPRLVSQARRLRRTVTVCPPVTTCHWQIRYFLSMCPKFCWYLEDKMAAVRCCHLGRVNSVSRSCCCRRSSSSSSCSRSSSRSCSYLLHSL